MPTITFKFNQKKAIEAIIYLAHKVSVPGIYNICKLLYLVDKASLERYGRFVFGETYFAMEGGGTPSNVYSFIKRISRRPTKELKIVENRIIPLREADLDNLSKSDIACLDQIIKEYGKVTDWSRRREECHDAAWEKAWAKRGTKKSVKMPVETIAGMFANADDLIDYLMNPG